MGNLKGNGNFHFPFGKLWELSPFPQNFPSKKCGEISSFFAVYCAHSKILQGVAKYRSIEILLGIAKRFIVTYAGEKWFLREVFSYYETRRINRKLCLVGSIH